MASGCVFYVFGVGGWGGMQLKGSVECVWFGG